MFKFMSLDEAEDNVHKYTITFKNIFTNKLKKISFGSIKYDDYTIHHDEKRKNNYLLRHQVRENWEDPFSKGALSKWILWSKKTIIESLVDYLTYFRNKRKII
jgi:hypothetical protein